MGWSFIKPQTYFSRPNVETFIADNVSHPFLKAGAEPKHVNKSLNQTYKEMRGITAGCSMTQQKLSAKARKSHLWHQIHVELLTGLRKRKKTNSSSFIPCKILWCVQQGVTMERKGWKLSIKKKKKKGFNLWHVSHYSAIFVQTELQLNGAIYLFESQTKLSSVGSLKEAMRPERKAPQNCRARKAWVLSSSINVKLLESQRLCWG